MSFIDVPTATGKSTKLVLSLDAETNAELNSYLKFLSATKRASLPASTVARLMVEKVLKTDRDYLAWKKKSPGQAQDTADAPPVDAEQVT